VATGRGCYTIAGGALAALLLAAGLATAWWLTEPAGLDGLRQGPPPPSWAALERQRSAWRAAGRQRDVRPRYVPLEEIAVELQLAVLVGEDIDFFGHGAVDPTAIREALAEWRRGRRLRGASTLSQQLAKNLYLSGERSAWRKVEELRLAWWLERRLGKRRILELYLNVVEFGPGLFGVESAARYYCGAGAGELEAEQAAGLAAAIPAPGRDNPATATRRWKFRQDTILARMSEAGWLRRKLAPSPPAR
jgi:monofunctional biosynthetic peptidoglycan transglycosylase